MIKLFLGFCLKKKDYSFRFCFS